MDVVSFAWAGLQSHLFSDGLPASNALGSHPVQVHKLETEILSHIGGCKTCMYNGKNV